jgi:hypothetical protein
MRLLETSSAILSFERGLGTERILCVFNLGLTATRLQAPPPGSWRLIESIGGASAWHLPPLSALVAEGT